MQILLGSPRIDLEQKGLRREQSHQLCHHRVTEREVIYGAGTDSLAVLYSDANKYIDEVVLYSVPKGRSERRENVSEI